MPSEAEWKREMVRRLLLEGSFARRIEDKYAVGSLDMLVVTQPYTIYAEAKLLKDIAALPASVAQRHQIKLVNRIGNPFCKALVVGLKNGMMGFGLPGEPWDKYYTSPWPIQDLPLTEVFNTAIFTIWGPHHDRPTAA
jgi:hypothetical protein